MIYTCPVCGFDQLPHPPRDYMICPSCGTEFGYTDFSTSHDDLREQWILKGALWHSKVFPSPSGWNPYAQLIAAGFVFHLTASASTDGDAQSRNIVVTRENIQNGFLGMGFENYANCTETT
jgi:hypothetical protein